MKDWQMPLTPLTLTCRLGALMNIEQLTMNYSLPVALLPIAPNYKSATQPKLNSSTKFWLIIICCVSKILYRNNDKMRVVFYSI